MEGRSSQILDPIPDWESGATAYGYTGEITPESDVEALREYIRGYMRMFGIGMGSTVFAESLMKIAAEISD